MEQRDHDLNAIITEEKLKPEDTWGHGECVP